MITEDPQLETRLRHYGSILRNDIQVSPALHTQIVQGLDRRQPARPRRLVMQLAVTAAMLLVAVGGVVLVQRARANELAKAEPRLSSISPPDGATDVQVLGEFRVAFATRPATSPQLTHVPADGSQAAPRWDGSTLVVGYSGLRTGQRYEVMLQSDYTSAFGGKGHFEKRWTFTTELGPPAANVGPLIWYSTASPYGAAPQVGPWVAVDWNGTVVGKLKASGGVNQSPDGTRLGMPGVGYVDQAGQTIAAVQVDKGGPSWSDDSRHFCVMRTASGGAPTGNGRAPTGNGEPAWLFAGPIEGPLRRVAQAGQFGGQSGPGAVACSFLSDRAVVVETVIMGASDVWVIKLSTGAPIYHHQYSSEQTPFIRASHDGQYLAEQTAAVDAQGALRHGATVIRRISDGKEVARLDKQTVVTFSWDGSLVVTMPASGSFGTNEARLIDWKSGTILWRLPGPPGTNGGEAVYALARPNGTDLVVGVGPQSADGIDQLWLVTATGTARPIAKGPLWTGF
ncbi:MAG TPA: Ig-like domain-containing protein [Candidatus Binatus sp.]|nr:Ig-like domain-containing protein [Candidatus Binatus sp.]